MSKDSEKVEKDKKSEVEEKSEEKKSNDDKKSEDNKKSEDDKKPDNIKKSDDDKKSEDDKKILNSINRSSRKKKNFLPESIQNIVDGISLKYVLTVAGGVLFCIFVIGSVLIFADTDSIKSLEGNISTTAENTVEKRIHIKIRAGMSTGEIADQLEEKGVITSSLKFRVLSRIRGYDDKMKLGTYVFTAGMADEEVFAKLLSGEKYLVTFTIPEGFGVKNIADRLYEIDLIDKEDFLKAAENFTPYDYMKKHDNVIYAAEGFLFPDTYSIESDASVEDILNLMVREFDNKLTPAMREKAKEMNLSIYDLTTLASIVEREVRYPADRPVVAQVFLKRLKINMPLQTDASLQYLMDAPKEDVSIEDTQIDSPYNTYQHAGLPPGPIASPGLEAIKAVLNPADTDYLYFVADRDGHNHYSGTYAEHMELVNQYR